MDAKSDGNEEDVSVSTRADAAGDDKTRGPIFFFDSLPRSPHFSTYRSCLADAPRWFWPVSSILERTVWIIKSRHIHSTLRKRRETEQAPRSSHIQPHADLTLCLSFFLSLLTKSTSYWWEKANEGEPHPERTSSFLVIFLKTFFLFSVKPIVWLVFSFFFLSLLTWEIVDPFKWCARCCRASLIAITQTCQSEKIK